MGTGTALAVASEAGLPHLHRWWWGLGQLHTCVGGLCFSFLDCDACQWREHTRGCCIAWELRLQPSFRDENNLRSIHALGSKIILPSPCYRSSFIFPWHYFPSSSEGLVYWSIYSVEVGLNSPESQSFLFCMGEAWYWCDWNIPLLSALKGRDDSCVKLFELTFNSWQ